MTLVFSPDQALLEAVAGCTHVSPSFERLEGIGQDGMDVVRQAAAILDQYNPAQELAISIRGPQHVTQAARASAHIATLAVLQAMLRHFLTDTGIERSLADSRKYALV